MSHQEPKVAVALSGGVDSATAAARLKQQGWQVLGVHVRLSEFGPPQEQVAALAAHLAIPLQVVDLRQDFARGVLAYFAAEYARGRTPNPCVTCNALIKFGRLWEEVKAACLNHLATGHYARLQPGPDGSPGIFRGKDRHKDQTYFLCRLPRKLLGHLLFPLGDLTKSQVRARYQQLGFPPLPGRRESQELCFIPEGRYQDFLDRQGGCASRPGDLVDLQGKILGRHRGLIHYTVGQRRGLGIPAREPYYVVEIQPETNRVVIGSRLDLLSAGLLASRSNWLIKPPDKEFTAQAVIRYRHPGVEAQIIPLSPTEVKVIFTTPQAAVTPGQAVAFYLNDQLLGGAWIEGRIK